MNPIPATDLTLCVVSTRVSSREQASDGYGLDAQAAAIDAFARREALTIVGRFTDAGISGTTPLDE
jgi:hypothetical protein